MFAGVVIIFRKFGLLIKCEKKIVIVLCVFIIGDMNRVLSFPQSHSCDNPSEVVSKRFCFSCIFSVSFISLIFGYLLGSKHSHHRLAHTNCTFGTYHFDDIKYLDILRNILPPDKNLNISNNKTYTNYDEAVLLKRHFEIYKFDEISPIIASNVPLSFKNKDKPDALEIVEGQGTLRYRNVRNTTYSYIIPHDATDIVSVANKVSGLPIYANYGTEDDFNFLTERGISLRGCIVVLRLGKISILEKVTSALRKGANGVLLFADPQQYPNVDVLSVNEEISPTLLANLQKIYNALGRNEIGVPVQIIEAMTAGNILREMTNANKPPESWRGNLTATYFIGPGFTFNNGRIVMYTYFQNVNYTSYDVAAYIRGVQEHDRYVILGNKRKTFTGRSNSMITLMEISKALAVLKSTKGWKPLRTIVFCSFGLEETESYSEESWFRTYQHVIEQRTIAYLDVKQPIQGLDYLNVEVSAPLQKLFENVSLLVENPNSEEKLGAKKSLFDVWYYRRRDSEYSQFQDNFNSSVMRRQKYENKAANGNELFALYGIPIISFGYDTEGEYLKENGNNIVNIYEYENAILQLWLLLTFSLANDLIVPFNISVYPAIINNMYETMFRENEKYLQNIDFIDDFRKFGESVKNLSTEIETFYNFQMNDKSLELRMINDKLMQIIKLIRCYDDDKIPILSKNSSPVFISFQKLFNENPTDRDKFRITLRKSMNCINEIIFLMNDAKS